MKINMKRRLQIQFVFLSVAALILLQALIVGFSIYRNYRQMTINADRLILRTNTSPDSSEISDARYFRVSFNPVDKNFETDLTHTSLVTQSAAMEYAKEVIDAKSSNGYVEHYRYLVHRGQDGIRITFLSRYKAMEAFRNHAETLILISVGGIAVMAIVLTILSAQVVSPLVKNHQRQKEFITSASHELKTPLTVIHADAQLLESEIGENEWLSDIIKQTTNMTEMTHKLVYLARAEEQDNHFVKIEFPISDVAEDVAEPYHSVAQSKGKNYTLDIQEGLSYCGDEKAIRELMTALLDNAFKYSSDGGSISASLIAEGKGVRFTVENTVTGIDPKQAEFFTQRFYRNDTSDKIKGFGIGLSLAQVVAGAHKGKLTVAMPQKDRIQISVILK